MTTFLILLLNIMWLVKTRRLKKELVKLVEKWLSYRILKFHGPGNAQKQVFC